MSTVDSTMQGRPDATKALNIGLWVLQVAAAAAFFMAGGAKLAGSPMMVQVFEKVGFGQWFRYVTGLLEVGSALLLLTPRFSGLGAIILACVMVGAVTAHLTLLGGSPMIPLVLLVIVAVIAWGRWPGTRALLTRR